MALPTFTMRQLLEAGVHFGHSTRRWNPKMAPYLYGVRSGVHIIDLQQTAPMLYRALSAVQKAASGGGRVLFVGTKRQATTCVAEAATRCGQYYVNHRWLGGMMTNWNTISNSIKRFKYLKKLLAGDAIGLTKKETLNLTRECDKLERALGGISEMAALPDIIIVIDTNKENIAINEARVLGIPVVGIIDSNSKPDNITWPIPGNDDAIRAIELYCDLFAGAVLDGIQDQFSNAGGDLGESVDAPTEDLSIPAEAPAEALMDAPVEAPMDAPAEAPMDAPVDAPAEAPMEAPADSPADTTVDVTAEISADPPMDTVADAAEQTPDETPPSQ